MALNSRICFNLRKYIENLFLAHKSMKLIHTTVYKDYSWAISFISYLV